MVRCISIISFASCANSTVQSNALSPPPNIITRLLKYFARSLTAYSRPFPSNSSNPSVSGFFGWKLPAPPAIIIFCVLNALPADVPIKNPSSDGTSYAIVCAKWKVGLNGLACNISSSVNA